MVGLTTIRCGYDADTIRPWMLGSRHIPTLLCPSSVTDSVRFLDSPSHKLGSGPGLDEYREAEKLGAVEGDCVSAYPECPISLFRSRKVA